MKTKVILSLALVGALVSSALSADYSKMSNEELIKLSGKVAPKDYPDYRMEIHKRMQEMKVKDANVFRDKLRESRWSAYEQMTYKEYLEYRENIDAEMQKYNESQAGKNGLIEYGPYRGGYGHHRGGYGPYRGYHHPCY